MGTEHFQTPVAHEPPLTLVPERALLRLDALLRLGRTREAQQLAQQLLAAQSDQPYRARIHELLRRGRS